MFAGFYVGVARSLPPLDLASASAHPDQTTKVFDDAEKPTLLAELHGVENREVLTSDQIPQVMRDAIVAVEDERFYVHSGVDFLGILRALWANLRQREIVQGGSTITQQYIKNAYINDDRTIDRKLKEATLAYQLEKQWSKEKILTEYLNIIYFGEGAYGIEAAAQEYFGVRAADLTIDQAALLAAIPKAPSAYSPRRDPEAALARRDLVLNKMYQQHYITSNELQEALAKPLKLAKQAGSQTTQVPYWVEMVREELVSRYGSSTVLGGGLRVYVSVDLSLQKQAEEAIASVLSSKNDPAAALVCVDVHTGKLLAMVGGQNFSQSQFNLATQGKRQPGSAFKPFVLATALAQGTSPDALYDSGPAQIELPDGTWSVDSTDEGPITLREATARSSNGVYARLVMDVGPEAVAKTANDMGIQTSFGQNPNPAIALGGLTTGVSPLEMAMAYATLATGGERLTATVPFNPTSTSFPVVIDRVTDSTGKVLDKNSIKRTPTLDSGIAAVVTSILEGVITDGTGTAAQIGRPAAGKTGTTSNYRDAWFVGYTPDIVTAVWVGYSDEQKAMTNVHGIRVTGGSFPAKIWAAFMKQAVKSIPASDFAKPSPDQWVEVEVCSESHQLPTPLCPTRVRMLFRAENVPTEECQIHKAKEISVPAVVGDTIADARALLGEAGFKVTYTEDPESSEPAGVVTHQDPPAGTALLQGRTVALVVSARTIQQVMVPTLTGLDIADARAQLSAIGLTANETSTPDASTAGTVLSQDIQPGTLVDPGTAVNLLISSGPDSTTSSTEALNGGLVD
ncbi:MAG: PBP1A family penicillin-binding protein [Actinobacteria bacterium]|nr:PBP1A family penicillin-binding protein [Actinomycetota bacterium]